MASQRGFFLVATVFIVLTMALLAIVFSSFISSDAVEAVHNYHSLDTFYIASSGLEFYLRHLEQDDDWTTLPLEVVREFSGGVFVITTTDESKDRIALEITGILTVGATTYRRVITPGLKRVTGGLETILNDYVIYWGGGTGTGSTLGENVTIIGDLFANGDLEIGSNSIISGDAEATGTVDLGSGSTVSGTTEENAEPPYQPPTLDTSEYDAEIANAATLPSGNWTLDSTTLTGTYYVNGDITVPLNANLVVNGEATIVATGKVTVKNNVVVGDNLTVIAGGKIDLANSVFIGESGLWFSSTELEVGNNAAVGDVDVGEGTVFLTAGDVTFGNNIDFTGVLYADGDFTQTGNNFYFEGNIIVAGDINVDNNTTLVLNPDVVDTEDLDMITTEVTEESFEVESWDEAY
ncbi:hypothetical protein ACFL4J_00430 [Candidatus Margulisiibacteriota bacterium]